MIHPTQKLYEDSFTSEELVRFKGLEDRFFQIGDLVTLRGEYMRIMNFSPFTVEATNIKTSPYMCPKERTEQIHRRMREFRGFIMNEPVSFSNPSLLRDFLNANHVEANDIANRIAIWRNSLIAP